MPEALCIKCDTVVRGEDIEEAMSDHAIDYHMNEFLNDFADEFVAWAKSECFNFKEGCS